MNVIATRAAEGLPRRSFTVEEILRMVEAGIIAEDENFELIEGEIVPMSPKGARHEWVKRVLDRHFQRAASDRFEVSPETTVALDDRAFVEPDLCVFPSGLGPRRIDGSRLLLVVEVADSSLAYDLGRKIGVYAAYGVREVWVIDARTLVTRLHRRLGAMGYAEIVERGPAERLEPMLAPELAVTLAALGLTPAAPEE